MTRSSPSFLSTKAGPRSLIQVAQKTGPGSARASPIRLRRGQLCTCPAVPHFWASVPHLCTKRVAFLWPLPVPTAVGAAHPHAGPGSTSLPLPKRGKETCVKASGRARAPSCEAARLLPGERTSHKPQDRKVPPPGRHSYPATPLTQTRPAAPPRTTSRFPGDPSRPSDRPQREAVRKRPTPPLCGGGD